MPSICAIGMMCMLACATNVHNDPALEACSGQNDVEDIASFLQVPSPRKQLKQDAGVESASASLDRSGPMSPSDTYKLSDGYEMPVIGLGMFQMKPGNESYSTVAAALKMGYRMFDCAELYGNEEDLGQAIRDSGIPRSEIFITTKLTFQFTYDEAVKALTESNAKLGLGYVDLMLVHRPNGYDLEAWDALVHMREIGVTRSIGISNYDSNYKHGFFVDELRKAGRPIPAVQQIELHPLVWHDESPIVEKCKQAGIQVQAYGSVLHGHDDLMSAATAIGSKYNKTGYQVMLRWALDKGFQVIPKSTHVQYLAENLDVFDFTLTAEDTKSLEGLPQIMPGSIYS